MVETQAPFSRHRFPYGDPGAVDQVVENTRGIRVDDAASGDEPPSRAFLKYPASDIPDLAAFALAALTPEGGAVTDDTATLEFRTRRIFADVANYTSLAEKLDPEKVHEIMDVAGDLLLVAEGMLEGLVKGGILARKEAQEKRLAEWIAADPARQNVRSFALPLRELLHLLELAGERLTADESPLRAEKLTAMPVSGKAGAIPCDF
jgi:hypothetical protein